MSKTEFGFLGELFPYNVVIDRTGTVGLIFNIKN